MAKESVDVTHGFVEANEQVVVMGIPQETDQIGLSYGNGRVTGERSGQVEKRLSVIVKE